MSIGKRISELRKEKNFSQEYVAERLNVSRQAVSKWEQELSSPDTKNLIALSELFEVSVEYLVIGKPDAVNSTPSKNKGIGITQILGIIFVSIGLLSLCMGIIFSWLLIALAIILLTCGIIFLTLSKKALKIIVPMIALMILGLFSTMFTGLNAVIAIGIIIGSIVTVLAVWLAAVWISRTKR